MPYREEQDDNLGETGVTEHVAAGLAQQQKDLSAALGALKQNPAVLARVVQAVLDTLRNGGKVLLAGNGGSAAEAQHFSAELIGRFKHDRRPYAALALTTDTSTLTAVGNDFGFDDVFARQIAALGKSGDCFIAFSTSGESPNLIRAADEARNRGLTVIALTGAKPSSLADRATIALPVPSADTATVQVLHMIATHLICASVEEQLMADDGGSNRRDQP